MTDEEQPREWYEFLAEIIVEAMLEIEENESQKQTT